MPHFSPNSTEKNEHLMRGHWWIRRNGMGSLVFEVLTSLYHAKCKSGLSVLPVIWWEAR